MKECVHVRIFRDTWCGFKLCGRYRKVPRSELILTKALGVADDYGRAVTRRETSQAIDSVSRFLFWGKLRTSPSTSSGQEIKVRSRRVDANRINFDIMKTLTVLLFLIVYSIATSAQSIAYYMPEKKLRITVAYKLTGYVLTNGAGDDVLDSKYELVITDPVKVEEVVVPDMNRRFEVKIPERLPAVGARFDWKVQLDKHGILTGWNASREPVTAQILAGGVGFIANVLTGVTQVGGLIPALAAKSYKVDTEQKFTITQTIDVPANGLDEVTVAVPDIDVQLSTVPSVTLSLQPSAATATESGITRRTDALHYIEPRVYRLVVDVKNNGLVPSTRVIDEVILIPQHGALRQIALTELFRGRKAAALSLDPATGQLLSWEYKRSGTSRTETSDLSKQLSVLAASVAAARAASDQRLEQEVRRLSLELERLELQRKLQE